MGFWDNAGGAVAHDEYGYPCFDSWLYAERWYHSLTSKERKQYDERDKNKIYIGKDKNQNLNNIQIYESDITDKMNKNKIIIGHIYEEEFKEKNFNYCNEDYNDKKWYKCTDEVIEKINREKYDVYFDLFEFTIDKKTLVCIDINKVKQNLPCGIIEEVRFKKDYYPIIKINNNMYWIMLKNINGVIINIFENKNRIYYRIKDERYIDYIEIKND